MLIAVTGSSGLIGSSLVNALRQDGHEVLRLVRRPPRQGEAQWDGTRLSPQALHGVDGVVHLAGAGVGDKRWSADYKRQVLESRVLGTTAVAHAVAHAGVPVLLSSSAIGWYGDTGDRVTDETGPHGEGFLADVCLAWERATEPAEATSRVVHLRTGIVLSAAGGALKKQLPVFKAGLGAPLGSGKQWVSWISRRDEVAAIRHLLAADLRGPVNLVAPNPVTNKAFTKELGSVLHRPTSPIGVPGLALRVALGEFAGEVLTGQRLVPKALQDSGFRFAHSDLRSALESSLSVQ
jgi:uncharacterized protein (TIGR01777 family)